MSESLPTTRPLTRLAGPPGHPVHPMLIPLPIGAFAASLTFDVSSRVVGDSAFLWQGAYWLLGIGIATTVLAAAFGFLDLFVVPPGTTAFRTGAAHMLANVAALGVFVADFLWRAQALAAHSQSPVGFIALSAAGFAVLGFGGWIGGRLPYRHGVRVAAPASIEVPR